MIGDARWSQTQESVRGTTIRPTTIRPSLSLQVVLEGLKKTTRASTTCADATIPAMICDHKHTVSMACATFFEGIPKNSLNGEKEKINIYTV